MEFTIKFVDIKNMEINNYIGEECCFIDKVTYKKIYEGANLGKCIKEGVHDLHNLPILWFDKPFLGFKWQYKSDVRVRII